MILYTVDFAFWNIRQQRIAPSSSVIPHTLVHVCLMRGFLWGLLLIVTRDQNTVLMFSLKSLEFF